jgi:hypothetical protein
MLLLLCLARGLYKQAAAAHHDIQTHNAGIRQRIMTFKHTMHTMQELDTLFNGPNGSVRDIYQRNSYGQLTINSVFTGWIQLNITEAQAANGRLGMSCCSLQNAIRTALDIAQAQGTAFSGLDQNRDGRIDMISILHSGYAAEWGGDDYTSRIWYAIVNQLRLLARLYIATVSAIRLLAHCSSPLICAGATNGGCASRGSLRMA